MTKTTTAVRPVVAFMFLKSYTPYITSSHNLTRVLRILLLKIVYSESKYMEISFYRLLIAVTRASMEARMMSGSTPAPHAIVPSGFLIPT